MSLPPTFKAAVVETAGKSKLYDPSLQQEVPVKFELKDIPLKKPTYGYVLVKVIASGVCGSDVHVLNGAVGSQFPHVAGHEIIGEIAAIPETEDHWQIGDRVGGGWHGGHCHFCKYCKRGEFLLCEKEAVNGVSMWGGLAEYVLLRREAVVSVPKDVDPASYAPILCAGVTVFNSLRNMHIRHGGLVAVAGVGGLGHLAVQYARKMGYKVVAIARDPAKRDEALKFGASAYFDRTHNAAEELKKLGGADCIVLTANNGNLVSQLQPGLARGGTFLTVAIAGNATFDTVPAVVQKQAFRGWPCGSAIDSEDAIDFAKNFGVECAIQKYSLDQIQEAYDSVDQGKARYRNVIVFQ